MVALLTPDREAIASTLVESIPFSAKRLRAASRTLWCARWLRPRAISDLDLGKPPSPENQQSDGDAGKRRQVGGHAKLAGADERTAQPIDAVGKRIQPGEHREDSGQV